MRDCRAFGPLYCSYVGRQSRASAAIWLGAACTSYASREQTHAGGHFLFPMDAPGARCAGGPRRRATGRNDDSALALSRSVVASAYPRDDTCIGRANQPTESAIGFLGLVIPTEWNPSFQIANSRDFCCGSICQRQASANSHQTESTAYAVSAEQDRTAPPPSSFFEGLGQLVLKRLHEIRNRRAGPGCGRDLGGHPGHELLVIGRAGLSAGIVIRTVQ
jgi:hypothetical protein